MKTFMWSVYITFPITIIALIISCILNCFGNESSDFLCDIMLGIFGSSLLTCIGSFISYMNERKKVLEEFYCQTQFLLDKINLYEPNWKEDKKISYFLDYIDNGFLDWNRSLGNISLLMDFNGNTFKYIYENIYIPIFIYNNEIIKHSRVFRWYKNIDTITDKLNLIENILYKPIQDNNVEDDYDYNFGCGCNILFETIYQELNGKYYEIMYGKKKADKFRNDLKF